MSRLQILDRAGAAQVEEVCSCAVVTSAATLTLADVGEAMLDDDTFPQPTAPSGAGHQLSESMLEAFVCGDGDGSSARCSSEAVSPHPAPKTKRQ